jgi:hypothetical protein
MPAEFRRVKGQNRAGYHGSTINKSRQLETNAERPSPMQAVQAEWILLQLLTKHGSAL